MSDYDAEYERQRQLEQERNRLLSERNAEAQRYNRLIVETESCQIDTQRCTAIIGQLGQKVAPPLSETAADTDKKQVIAENVSRTVTDLADSYRLLKNGSTASKNLTGDFEKYYTYYGLYNELRQVALGYVVGLDANLWQSDAPRKKVEKMYLANTDYWLAYATMAVMLWASDEEEACARAVSKSMQMDERRSALFFLLASLRFNRIEAAKEWYRVYFDLVEAGGIGEEIVYILQVLLCGALGADVEFGRAVQTRMRELLAETKNDVSSRQAAQACMDRYFEAYVYVTRNEYLALKHICGDYDEMIKLLSAAEKNAKLKDAFWQALNADTALSDRLAERIEDALYSLISSYDVSEQELLDQIAYEQAVVKARGDLDEAKQAFDKAMENRRQNNNLAAIMANTALGAYPNTDSRVRKFALDFMRNECLQGAEKFAQYRKKEKAAYDFAIDGCALHGDENSFEENKPKLLKHYDGMIKERIKADKTASSMRTSCVATCAVAVLFTILFAVGLAAGWKTSATVTMIAIAVVCFGMFALCIFLMIERRQKIRKSFAYRIENGVKMLEDGLKDLGAWRTAYKTADSVHDELIQILKEVNS